MCVEIIILLENIKGADSGYTARKQARGIGTYTVSLHKLLVLSEKTK